MIVVNGRGVWLAWPFITALVVFLELRRHKSLWHMLGVIALTTYGIWIASVAFFPMYLGHESAAEMHWTGWTGINLVPFRSLVQSFSFKLGAWWLIRMDGGNFLLLVPHTLLGPVLWPKLRRWWKALLLGLGLSLAIELVQLSLRLVAAPPYRSVDIDDVIVNTAGAMCGYGLYVLARWYAARHRPAVQDINRGSRMREAREGPHG